MSKPTTVPTWDTGAVNTVAPSVGQRTNGWSLNDTPTSGVFNHEMNLYGAWAQYLNDGVFSGTITLTGDLNVNGSIGQGDRDTPTLAGQDAFVVSGTTAYEPDGFIVRGGSVGAAVWQWTIPVGGKDVLKSVTIRYHGDSLGAANTAILVKQRTSTSSTVVGTGSFTTPGAPSSGVDHTTSVTSPVTLSPGDLVLFQVSVATATVRVNHVRGIYSRVV